MARRPEPDPIEDDGFDIEPALRLLHRTLTGKEMPPDADPHEEISKLQFSEVNVRRLGFYSLAVLNAGAIKGVVRCAEDIVKLAFNQVDKPFADRIAGTTLDQTKELLYVEYLASGLTSREARAKVNEDIKAGLLGDAAN
jgi:hypothetical protein